MTLNNAEYNNLGNYGIVLIDYNSGNRTCKFIEDFVQVADIHPEIIVVVDNYIKNEDSFERLRSFFNCISDYPTENDEYCKRYCYGSYKGIRTILVKAKINLGYAKANNIGAKILKKYRIENILFSNSDIIFDYSPLKISLFLLKLKNNKKILAIGSDVFSIDRLTRQSPCRYMTIKERYLANYSFWPLNKLFVKNNSDTIIPDHAQEVYRVIGAFFMVNTFRFFDCGGFDGNTFLYAEECILSERGLKKGYIMYYIPNVPVVHEDGFTTDNMKGKFNANRLRLRLNSDMYYYEKYRHVPKIITTYTKMTVNIYIIKRELVLKLLKR